ncbi:MAG: GSCFA domain-containing protein [Dysgonomonas sp.]
MDFRTEIFISKSSFSIAHQTRLLLFGSCFTENIGSCLQQNKFDVNLNPFGVLYNSASICQALNFSFSDRTIGQEDIFSSQGAYHSFLFHSSFSDANTASCLDKMNNSLQNLRKNISSYDVLFITFGSAYVYIHNKTNNIVSNCHKLPAGDFTRKRLNVDEISREWIRVIGLLREKNPRLKVVFTVSPIRHWSDGAHENQLSKSILLLSIDKLQQSLDGIYYFPSYELLLDDLRDYRFYSEDMVHPNSLALKYIWEKFSAAFFETHTIQIMDEWTKIARAIEHRPFNEHSKEHQHFLKQTLLKLHTFQDKYPYIDCSKEYNLVESKLSI